MHTLPVKRSDSPATTTIPAPRHTAAAHRPVQPTRPLSTRLAAVVGAVLTSSILLGSVLMLFDPSTAATTQVEAEAAASLGARTGA